MRAKDVSQITPEKRREIIHKLNLGVEYEKNVKKKVTMDNILGTVKADNIFGGITYAKEK
jgi:hypothetical protein